jgi:hypothetical protein
MAETYEYRGVLFAKMGRKADAEKDLTILKKLNKKLAGELEEFLKTARKKMSMAALPLQSKRPRVVKVFQEAWKTFVKEVPPNANRQVGGIEH